ncbi:hypothetical protein SDRG_00939 [Saprolegnia diclina VS20]|uniref:Uncharacterized protein n=1 Tax=Saprolegnia diclina (strain VS20) TaxID=1156394 RepID=T0S9X2_SAPDV|nr:hypothetical protein SDRG_00939 [Saprolegnia diclina VS20]EQC42098.1 hypothetical protein SDRG_00939 [Saprolegnia diclina VS20]|eukprot:XP_008604667.1 hypothetical protein SDRG_00939 [Saprolegnia diclina VS20]
MTTATAAYEGIAQAIHARPALADTLPFWVPVVHAASAPRQLAWPLTGDKAAQLGHGDVASWCQVPQAHVVQDGVLDQVMRAAVQALGCTTPDTCAIVFSHLTIDVAGGDVKAYEPPSRPPDGAFGALVILPPSDAVGGLFSTQGDSPLEWAAPAHTASYLAFESWSHVSVGPIRAGLRTAIVYHLVDRSCNNGWSPRTLAVAGALRSAAMRPQPTPYTAWRLNDWSESAGSISVVLAQQQGAERLAVDALVAADCFDVVFLHAAHGLVGSCVHPALEVPRLVTQEFAYNIEDRIYVDEPLRSPRETLSLWVVFWPKRQRVRIINWTYTLANLLALHRGKGDLWGYASIDEMFQNMMEMICATDHQLRLEQINPTALGDVLLTIGDVGRATTFVTACVCRSAFLLDANVAAWTLRAVARFGWTDMASSLSTLAIAVLQQSPELAFEWLRRLVDDHRDHTHATVAYIQQSFCVFLTWLRDGATASNTLVVNALSVDAFLGANAPFVPLDDLALVARLPSTLLGLVHEFAAPPRALNVLLARMEKLPNDAHLVCLLARAVLDQPGASQRVNMQRVLAAYHQLPESTAPHLSDASGYIVEVAHRLGAVDGILDRLQEHYGAAWLPAMARLVDDPHFAGNKQHLASVVELLLPTAFNDEYECHVNTEASAVRCTQAAAIARLCDFLGANHLLAQAVDELIERMNDVFDVDNITPIALHFYEHVATQPEARPLGERCLARVQTWTNDQAILDLVVPVETLSDCDCNDCGALVSFLRDGTQSYLEVPARAVGCTGRGWLESERRLTSTRFSVHTNKNSDVLRVIKFDHYELQARATVQFLRASLA